MGKRGRPRLPIGDPETEIVREYQRNTSARYYRENREKILRKASTNHAKKKKKKQEDKKVKEVTVPEPLIRIDKEGEPGIGMSYRALMITKLLEEEEEE